MKIYIAGKITGEPDYWEKFNEAENKIQVAFPTATILNPAWLPEGMTPADYMSICLPMLMAADLVCFLPDWQNSGGARIEHALAEYIGKAIIEREAATT